ncbi:MAG: delta-aminolevulinic acid dehydratase [Deltaproteobacteria bacterium RIFCSPLOWO2_12_FULL_40_28]|nr:MAG: delta-aminolevulinic acid dehydratase [Deltaproteobacteria bacterium RIFCSPHIGHO2_02_FULL_40_28]OGQ19967.1 MAG: delta-aminolevulinic acid dehydratase [Deltaproteobacteria bacterium RIFCSPHIGHO2_12_FULL_40_32]OGQ39727.1 MAG: delta-aminolevulinic acid dehydratase [Deltaproteobacteria bacterium RIFCSPLOWO2_02_FULL_40_36]OGQ52982.1 MAG: delta-aminolevulinic acid dehydratase [Deltaproteobacteria bacterium RIFCSPLOWO2_12_FULL_40_28]
MKTLIQRPRRLRINSHLRALVSETTVSSKHLIQPLFIKEGLKTKKPIPSMPGQYQWSLKDCALEAKSCYQAGIPAVILFGIPQKKNSQGSYAHAANGIIQKAIDAIKNKCPELLVISDVCLCEYTSHGHCGLINKKGSVDNDATLDILSQVAVSHAKAGADMVAPSDMMDGRIGAIRAALDTKGYSNTPIMSYAVKYASPLYATFRDAARSKIQFGDRKDYQMDYANAKEALREARLDEKQGADILLVKPALFYLDIISKISQASSLPVAAYQVSGEYMMINALSQNAGYSKKELIHESFVAIKRAGAQMIVSYFAKEWARLV